MHMNQIKITIYTKSDCPYCSAALSLLKWNELDYDEINLSNYTEEEINKLPIKHEDDYLPAIYINDEYIGSYKQLVEFTTSSS